jgi:hypothetical protein
VFGRYEGDFAYSDGNVAIAIERSAPLPRYLRTCGNERVEKILPAGEGVIIINPVEPVNLPLPLSPYLEIGFPALVLPPRSERELFLTFPLEIGVFFEAGGDLHVLDVFSKVPAKFSLYGSPASGQITRWHRSGVWEQAPAVDRLLLGILDLMVRNPSSVTVEVTRTVLDSGSMRLFYGDYVTMAAVMEVYSPAIARTTVRETACSPGRERCIELYTARKIPAAHGKGHLMEYGVA